MPTAAFATDTAFGSTETGSAPVEKSGRYKMTIDRAIVITLALVCAVMSVAFNTEKNGRIADAFLIAAYIIVGSAIVIWRIAG